MYCQISKPQSYFDAHVAGLRLDPLLALLWHSVREALCHDDTDTSLSHSGGTSGSGIGRSSCNSGDQTAQPKLDEPAVALTLSGAVEEGEEKELNEDLFNLHFPPFPHGMMGRSALPPIAPKSDETSGPLQEAGPKHGPTMMASADGTADEVSEEDEKGEEKDFIASSGAAFVPFHGMQAVPSYAGGGPIALQSTTGTSHVPGPNDSADAWVQPSPRRASTSNVFVDINDAANRTTPTPLAAAAATSHMKMHQSRQQGLLAWAPDGRRCQLEALGPLFEEYRTSSPLTATFFLALVLRWVVWKDPHTYYEVWGQGEAWKESPGAEGTPSCSALCSCALPFP